MRWLPGLIALMWLGGCQKPDPGGAATQAPAAAEPSALAVDAEGKERTKLEVVEAAWAEVDDLLEAPGQLTWNEDRLWSIGVVATGKVLQTFSRVGDVVKPGQVMARLHTHDVHDTRAFLRQAKAEQERALAQLELAKRNRERMKRLLDLKAISQMQLDQAESEVRNAEAAVKRSKADVDRETQHLTEVLEISAEDDEDHAQHVHQPGQYDESELVPIKSTAAGVVVDRKISVGSVCNLGQEAFTVADPESLWLIASFPERSLARLRVGQTVGISVQAYPGETFTGRILRLGDTLDRETRTLKVRIGVAARGRLKPEMFATVRLGGTSSRELAIPASAVQEVDGRSTVFLETKAGEFTPRPVEVEMRGAQAIVRAGLKAGDRVAAKGSYFLKGRLVQDREGQ